MARTITREQLATAYRKFFAGDAVQAGAVVLEYGLTRVRSERDGAPAGGDGRGTEEVSAEL